MQKVYDGAYFDNWLLRKQRDDFISRGAGAAQPVRTVICKVCDGDQFSVGHDRFLTVIKCNNCDYEIAIHDG